MEFSQNLRLVMISLTRLVGNAGLFIQTGHVGVQAFSAINYLVYTVEVLGIWGRTWVALIDTGSTRLELRDVQSRAFLDFLELVLMVMEIEGALISTVENRIKPPVQLPILSCPSASLSRIIPLPVGLSPLSTTGLETLRSFFTHSHVWLHYKCHHARP